MTDRNSRMNQLLAQNKLKKRATVVVRHWASLGVSVSPVSHERYSLLVDKLHGGRSWTLQWTDDLFGEVRAFTVGSDMLTILGWDAHHEPPVLVGADKLLANLASLNELYADGFTLISDVQSKALMVDFDEVDGTTHFNVVDLH